MIAMFPIPDEVLLEMMDEDCIDRNAEAEMNEEPKDSE